MNPLIAKSTESTAIQARASVAAPETAAGEFMFMPAGDHTIFCKQGAKDIAAQVRVDRSAAAAMQQQLEAVKARSAHRPFCDFDHDDKQASFWPEAFAWRDGSAPGIYVRGEWSKAGKDAIEGKTYRAFSPVFHVDNPKAKPARVICQEGAGLNFGGLVNNPAFKQICPIWAKDAGEPSAAKQNTTHMNKTKAELEAEIQQINTEIAGLQAQDQGDATVAESLQAKQGGLELLNAQLAARTAQDAQMVLEKEVMSNRAAKAQAAVAQAVKRGAIAIKNVALQASLTKKATEDPDILTTINELPGSPALKGHDEGGGPRAIIRPLVGITRESTGNVLNFASALCARQGSIGDGANDSLLSQKALAAKETAAFYAKEIMPRLKEGDDIPLSGANSLGTLAQTLTAIRTLELLQLSFPLLQSIMTDFSDQIVSYGDTLKSRFVGIPTVRTYNTSTGWPTDSDVTTTDVSITYDQYKGVPIKFLGHEVAGTIRRLFDEIAPAQAYALGKDIVDYIYALITSAYTNTVTQAGLGTFGRSTIIDIGGVLDDAGVPEMGRFLLLNRPYYSALSKDNTIIQLAAFQRASLIEKGLEQSTLPDIEGFKLFKAVNLPATVISGSTVLKGFAGSKSAIALATRLSADYVNAMPGAGNGTLDVVTTPGGFSANLVRYVSHGAAAAYQRMEIIYGGSRGQVGSGALLTDV